MIKTKSVYKPIDEEDGIRVLITRWYPRGVKREKYDIWVRSLAPSAELLKRYKNTEIEWNDFKSTLLSELRDNIDSVEAIYALQAKNITQNITLLCYEKDGYPCHRHMVRDLIEDPRLLESKFIPENTNNHKSTPMKIHVSNKKCLVIP
ncbi:MAG: hypothetical protein K8823_40 [Cenarchaeum symbiont of Oopsacas minuta]|nr:hypothetical protein [Cenarchaeum symbiont of Oopsacas minuta]